MKKIWVYLLGILSGVILTFIVLFLIGLSRTNTNHPNSIPGLTFFDEPGEQMSDKSYEVFQALGPGAALAKGKEDEFSSFYFGLHVLLWDENGTPFYDEQIVTAPQGKCFRQIGVYNYPTKVGIDKTVPVVTLMDGEMPKSEIVDKKNNDYTFFDEPGEIMADKSYRVDVVLDDGIAIAQGKGDNYDDEHWFGLQVLLLDEKANYYNNQIVKASNGKCFRQIGVYKYQESLFDNKTLPIVTIMDK